MELLNQKSRYQEWKRLREAGHDYRTAYTLSSDNPLATHNRLDKLRKDVLNYINSGKTDGEHPVLEDLPFMGKSKGKEPCAIADNEPRETRTDQSLLTRIVNTAV